MNMPGFTAERSLCASRAPYRMTATKFLSAHDEIRPQMTMCSYLERRISSLGDELGHAAAAQDWRAVSDSLQTLRNTLTAYVNGRC